MKIQHSLKPLLAGVMLASSGLVFGQNFFPPNIAATEGNQQNAQSNNQNIPRGNILAIKMPQKGLGRKLIEDTTFSYYQQFLGPTFSDSSRTYNPFQAANSGRENQSGQAPMQGYHVLNLRHQINQDWAVGVSAAFTSGYTPEVRNTNNDVNRPTGQGLNARLNLSVPSFKTKLGTLFSTFSLEAPTSKASHNEDMRYGWVVAESFAFNLPSLKWTAGIMGQAYRMYYKNNVVPYYFADGSQGIPTSNQTLILSGGPYANYRISDKWMVGGLVNLDWDWRGDQTNTTKFGNNLPHRARTTLTYFPAIKHFASVGVFTQGLLKYRPETTAVGAEFALRF